MAFCGFLSSLVILALSNNLLLATCVGVSSEGNSNEINPQVFEKGNNPKGNVTTVEGRSVHKRDNYNSLDEDNDNVNTKWKQKPENSSKSRDQKAAHRQIGLHDNVDHEEPVMIKKTDDFIQKNQQWSNVGKRDGSGSNKENTNRRDNNFDDLEINEKLGTDGVVGTVDGDFEKENTFKRPREAVGEKLYDNELNDKYFHHLQKRSRMQTSYYSGDENDDDDDDDHGNDVKLRHEEKEGKEYIKGYSSLMNNLFSRPPVKFQISPFDYNARKNDDSSISIRFNPYKVLAVNEREQSVSIASYVCVKWNDDALRWPPSQYNNISKIHMKTDEIWTPSILIPRADGDGFVLRKPEYVSVNTDKKDNVKMSTLFKFTTSCELDLSRFPFDTQECSVLFRDENSRPLSAHDPDNSSDILSEFISTSSEWDIEERWADTIQQSGDCRYPDAVMYSISMSRRSTFYVANLLIPLHMTSFVALFVFWIPPETGEKISFMVSIYVSTAMYLSFINDQLPHSLIKLPAFNVITVCINVQIALTFIASLLVLRQYRYQTDLSSTTRSDHDHQNSQPNKNKIDVLPMRPAKVNMNGVAAIDYLGCGPDGEVKKNELVDLHQLEQKLPEMSWLDYKFLDKMFFIVFCIAFVLILFTPWLLYN